ncbi:MAG: hypothetical protein ACTSX9_09595 [Candidatus Njordarchaeales archaeon]
MENKKVIDLLKEVLRQFSKCRKDKRGEYKYAKYLIFASILSNPLEWDTRSCEFGNHYKDLSIFHPSAFMDYHVLSRYYMMRILSAKFDVKYVDFYLREAIKSFAAINDYSTLLSVIGYAAQYLVDENLLDKALDALVAAKRIGGEERLPIIIQSLMEILERILEKKGCEDFIESFHKILTRLGIPQSYYENLYYNALRRLVKHCTGTKVLEQFIKETTGILSTEKVSFLILEEALDQVKKLSAMKDLLYRIPRSSLSSEEKEHILLRVLQFISTFSEHLSTNDFEELMNLIKSIVRGDDKLGYMNGIVFFLEAIFQLTKNKILKEDKILQAIRNLDKHGKQEIIGVLMADFVKALFKNGMIRQGLLSMDTAIYFLESVGDYVRIYELYGTIISELIKMGYYENAKHLLDTLNEYPRTSKLLIASLVYSPILKVIISVGNPEFLKEIDYRVLELERRGEFEFAAAILSEAALNFLENNNYSEATKRLKRIFQYERGWFEGLKVFEKMLSMKGVDDYKKVIEFVLKEIRNSELLAHLAMILANYGFKDIALELVNYLRILGGESGKIAKILSDIGISLLRNGFSDDILALIIEAINSLERAGGYFNALNTIGYVLALLDDIPQIFKFLRMLISTDPDIKRMMNLWGSETDEEVPGG